MKNIQNTEILKPANESTKLFEEQWKPFHLMVLKLIKGNTKLIEKKTLLNITQRRDDTIRERRLRYYMHLRDTLKIFSPAQIKDVEDLIKRIINLKNTELA